MEDRRCDVRIPDFNILPLLVQSLGSELVILLLYTRHCPDYGQVVLGGERSLLILFMMKVSSPITQNYKFGFMMLEIYGSTSAFMLTILLPV